jgi:hypothetical protein
MIPTRPVGYEGERRSWRRFARTLPVDQFIRDHWDDVGGLSSVASDKFGLHDSRFWFSNTPKTAEELRPVIEYLDRLAKRLKF